MLVGDFLDQFNTIHSVIIQAIPGNSGGAIVAASPDAGQTARRPLRHTGREGSTRCGRACNHPRSHHLQESAMNRMIRFAMTAALGATAAAAFAVPVQLDGSQEVPPVQTAAQGSGHIEVAADGSVSGSVSTHGVDATMAHIHRGAKGQAGPVVIPLVKGDDGSWNVPPGAKLDAEQMKAYEAGDLYVNVHSDQHKAGEIRAQITP
jgi:hypothetical protein